MISCPSQTYLARNLLNNSAKNSFHNKQKGGDTIKSCFNWAVVISTINLVLTKSAIDTKTFINSPAVKKAEASFEATAKYSYTYLINWSRDC
jgi:hypothetical protein